MPIFNGCPEYFFYCYINDKTIKGVDADKNISHFS